MELSDTKPQVLSIEQSKEVERHGVVESAISTLAAVKRLVAEYDRVKGERDNFERQFANILVEKETFRRQAKEANDQRDQLSNALATLTSQMDAIGARWMEAVKMARSQTMVGRSPAEKTTVPITPTAPRAQTAPTTSSSRPATDCPAGKAANVSNTTAAASDPISFEAFSRYLSQ